MSIGVTEKVDRIFAKGSGKSSSWERSLWGGLLSRWVGGVWTNGKIGLEKDGPKLSNPDEKKTGINFV